MSTSFPSSNDVFTEPSSPGTTALSSSGTGSRNHTQHHVDLGDAVEAMQSEATLLVHSHDGATARHGSKLSQANTHQSPDTDTATSALHHTLGTGANQSAAGNHTHTQATSHNSPDTDTATTALHHTIGTGANQAAAGDHVHSHPITIYFYATGSFVLASYPGLYAVEVEVVGGGGGSGYSPANDSTHFSFGRGGAGGGYAKALILAASLVASETITIGAAGTAGVLGTANGGAGGTTSFGSHLSATGGAGGTSSTQTISASGSSFARGAGGVPGGVYDVGIPGEGSGSVDFLTGKLQNVVGLRGGNSGGPHGQTNYESIGANSNSINAMAGVAGLGYGGGARGTVSVPSGGAQAAAAGSVGLVVVRLIY